MTMPYSDQSYGAPAQRPQGMAISALVLGVIGILLACFAFGGVLGLIGVVLGIVALRRVMRGTGGGKGMAIAGIVTGAIAALIGIVAAIYWAFVWSVAGPCMFETDPAAQQQCINEQVESRFATP